MPSLAVRVTAKQPRSAMRIACLPVPQATSSTGGDPLGYALALTSGLGYAINDARDTLSYERLAALVLLIGLIGFALDSLLARILERASWTPSAPGSRQRAAAHSIRPRRENTSLAPTSGASRSPPAASP